MLAVSFLVALIASLLATPIGMRLGWRLSLVDRVGRVRTIHPEEVPRTGGLVLAFVVLGGLGAALACGVVPAGARSSLPSLLAGGALFFAIGLCDDLHALRPRRKLAWQVLAALAMYGAGFEIGHVAAFDAELVLGPAGGCALTVAWLVGVVNALNLLDGSDGLAGGFSACCAAAVMLIARANGDVATALPAAVLAGATVGFLRFNLAPARVFLGDAGSLLLGATLAMLTARAGARASGAVTVGVPIILLGIPLLDTALAVARRVALGRPIGSGDADHIHHRLLQRGLSPRRVALLLSAIGAGSAGLAVVYARVRGLDRWLILGGLATGISWGLLALGYVSLRRDAWQTVLARRARNRAVRRVLADLAREQAAPEPFLRAAERLGPILGAAALTLEADGRVLAWRGKPDAGAETQEHRFAIGPAGQPLGTLALHLPAADGADLGFLVESLCRLLARPGATRIDAGSA